MQIRNILKLRIVIILAIISTNGSFLLAQQDSSKNILKVWRLKDDFLVEPTKFDTLITGFQIINPAENYSISNNWLGNLGSAWMTNIYFPTFDKERTDFNFDNKFLPYSYTKDKLIFYHSNTPYFDIHWTSSQRAINENQLSALYTQNINKKWNLGVRYRLISSAGQFPNTMTKEHSLNPFFSYNGEKYSAHFAFMRNRFRIEEGAGINDSLTNDPAFVQALLDKASSVYFKRSIFFSQQYKFGFTKKVVLNDSITESTFKELGRINHIFNYDKNYRVYLENQPLSEYFDSTSLYDDTNTRDSIRMYKMENKLYWTFKEIQRKNFMGRLTVGGALENINWINTGTHPVFDSIDNKTKKEVFTSRDTTFFDTKFNNIKLYGAIDARTRMFVFSANAHYYLGNILGETNKADNFELNFLIKKSVMLRKTKSDIYARFKLGRYSPYIYQMRYESNHYSWNNQFKIINNTQFRAGLNIPITRTHAEFAYALESNYIYYDSLAMPQQYTDKVFSVMSLRLHQDFMFGKNSRIGRLHIKNKLVYQLAPADMEDVIRLPKLCVYHTTYYEIDYFSKIKKFFIDVQLGYDVYYSSAYKAFGYNPATGQFYNSNFGRMAGDYPIFNVFLNARIKTALVFLKVENIANYIVDDKFYFILDRYSMNVAGFRFGVSWRFKN